MFEADVFDITPPPMVPSTFAFAEDPEPRQSIYLEELLELAISSKDLGTVNFNVLRLLLSDMITKLHKVDRTPVKLKENDANQIFNYLNYIQGEGPPGAYSPSEMLLNVQLRRSRHQSQLVGRPLKKTSQHKVHRGRKKKQKSQANVSVIAVPSIKSEAGQVEQILIKNSQSVLGASSEMQVKELCDTFPDEKSVQDAWWAEVDHIDFDQSPETLQDAVQLHRPQSRKQHEEEAVEQTCESCGKPKHAQPEHTMEQAETTENLSRQINLTLSGVIGPSLISQQDKSFEEAIKLLQSNDESLSSRVEQLETAFKTFLKVKGIPSVNFEVHDSPVSTLLSSPVESSRKIPLDDSEEYTDSEDNKADIQILFNNLANVIAECADQKDRIGQLIDAVRIIEAGMVTKQYITDMLNSKADKKQITTKVSYDEFGKTVDQLHSQLQNLMVESFQRNEHWRKVTSDFGDELTEKLDKVELAPIRAFFKSRLKNMEERVNALCKIVEEPDPVATRKKLLKDYHCISCDRRVNISGAVNRCTLPTIGGTSAMPSSSSHRAYDLHRLRTQRKHFDADAKDAAEKERQMKKDMTGLTGSERNMMEIVNRYVGTEPSSRKASKPMSVPNFPVPVAKNAKEMEETEVTPMMEYRNEYRMEE